MSLDPIITMKLNEMLNEIADMFKSPKLTLIVRNSEDIEKDSVVLTNDDLDWAVRCIDWAKENDSDD